MTDHIYISRMLHLSSAESDVLTGEELAHLTDCAQCRSLLNAFMSDSVNRRQSGTLPDQAEKNAN